MRITAYRTESYTATRVYETDEILANLPPEMIDDEQRKIMQDGGVPLLSFYDKISEKNWSVPIEFIIEIV